MTNVKNLELFFQHAPAADLIALAAIDTTGIVDGIIIEVSDSGFFKFQTPAVATPDGRDVITGNGGGVWIRLTLPAMITNTNGAIDITVGGTGKTTPQDAINELVGAPAAARTFLRSDGADVTMSPIEAADLPSTLTQDTTGTSSNVTGTVLFAKGGTGQTTQQDALDALVGSVVDGHYVQGDGVNIVMDGINAADIPTLNQDTTGTSQYATNIADGIANEIPYQTGADTTNFISPANNSVVITDGSGVPSMSHTLPSDVQGNITTVGAVTAGSWHGDIVTGAYGGTGIDNAANTITVGGNLSTDGALTFDGAYNTEITVTGTTAVTLPVAGTLATTSDIPSFPLAPNLGGTGIDNGASTITVSGNVSTDEALTVSGAYPTTLTVTDTTALTLPTSGTLINDTELASQLTGYETVFNGIEDASLFSVGYDAATRIFSVTYSTGAAYTVGGVRYVPTPGIVYTSAHSTTSQEYYLYYNPSGVLTVSSVEWNLLTDTTIASVYYNNSNAGGAAAGIPQYELHLGNKGMSNATHYNLHATRGTQLLDGCVATGYTLNLGGPSNVNWTTTAGNIADEDIIWPVASQPLGGANTYRILYLTGAAASPVWNWVDIAQYGMYHNGTDIYYNQNNGGTYQLTPVTTNNNWVNYYILETTAYNAPQVIVVMGQNVYTTAIAADAATFSDDCPNFGLFTSEAVVIYQVTYRRGAAVGDPGNAEISNFEQVIQSLVTSGVGGTIDAAGVTVSTGGFTNFFSPTDGNVQQCLDTLDTNVPFSLAHGGTNANLTASNGGILYSTDTAGAILSGTVTASQALLSGASTTPAWSTATYPATTTADQILYSSATNTISGLATANDGTLITSATGEPSISSTLPSAVQGNITQVGTITSGTWNGGIIAGTYGGTGINNGSNTITIGGNVSTGGALTLSGAYATTITVTDTTSVTMPTSGTLATTSQLPSLPLSGADGGTGVSNTSKTITIGGNVSTGGALTVSGAHDATFTLTDTTAVTFPTSGTLATTGGLPTLPLPMSDGGTNANLTASNGGILYSTATAGAILNGTATTGQIMRSGASTAPSWSTATYPATTTANQLLYSSAANTLAGLATANDGVLTTSATGVPSISSSLPAAINRTLETVFNGIVAGTFDVSYVPSTRVFSVGVLPDSYFAVQKVVYTGSSGSSSAHSTTAGLYYLYYNNSGVLTVSSTIFNFNTSAPLASVYYNPSNGGGAADSVLNFAQYAGDGGMTVPTRSNLHDTYGTKLKSGCVASGYTLNAGGPQNVSWETTSGIIENQGIVRLVYAQALGGANTYRVLWRTGSAGSPVWNWVDIAQNGIYHDGADIYYNQNNGGTYQLTAVTTDDRWVNYYIVATIEESQKQLIVVMGDTLYTDLATADAGTFAADCPDFDLFTEEAFVLYRVTYCRDYHYGYPGNAAIGSFTSVMQNLVDMNHLHVDSASNITMSTSSFGNVFDATDTNTQKCFNDLEGILGGTNNATLITSAAGEPSLSVTLPSAVQGNITSVGTIASGTWNGGVIAGTYGGTGVNNGSNTITIAGNISTGGALTLSGSFGTTLTVTDTTALTLPTSGTLATTAQIPSLPVSLANGGTNANLSASNGGIFYSTATAGAILAGTAVAGRMLRSGASTTPSWSTATYPATTTLNQILYSSAANVVSGIPVTNSGVFVTSATGLPWIKGPFTNGQLLIGYNGGSPQVASLGSTSGGISIATGAGTLAVNIDKGGYYITTACVYDATTQTLRKSWNVSSVTYTSTGLFTINFASSFANVYYAPATSCYAVSGYDWTVTLHTATTSALGIATLAGANLTNNPFVSVIISNGDTLT